MIINKNDGRIERLYLHNRDLRNQTANTNSLPGWIAFYHNPLGFYGVWGLSLPYC